jgi:chromosome segregation protein
MIWRNAYAMAFLSRIGATTLMQTTLIRDETTAALSLDLPEHARFAALRSATGGLRGKDHTRRTVELLEQLANGKMTKQRELILLKRSSAVRSAL